GLDITESTSLEDLLQIIEERRIVENEAHRARERQFQSSRDQQQTLLNEAIAEERRERERSERLNTRYENNETTMGDQQEILDARLGSLRELFGVLSTVAGDTRGVFEGSIVSVEYPDRGQFLGDLAAKMGTAVQLATIEEMEDLWIMLQRQMNETGKLTRFESEVEYTGGIRQDTEVIRVGDFNLISSDGYLNYDINVGEVRELARQPSAEFAGSARDLYSADPGEVVPFAIDPTRGGVLSLEIQKATLGQMVGSPFGGIATGSCYLPFCDGQGGMVGSIIILVGFIGVILAIERMITLSIMTAKVKKQKNNPAESSEGNPLGRIIGVYHANREIDTETLQLKMGEAVLLELPRITRNITIVQVISVVAPLMGLLGTVIGMIQTFQAITLYGTGDPKIMASGISTALMTTVLGLCVAIPTVLLHALVHQQSLGVIHVLDEQSEGIIAQHAEESGNKLD
ncbi:MAG: MotA/TolQ/ExbB proton channel family protein, partial [Gammaproteobacteria bacterium]|nr:MotA/TolQ/ExbB proton channel family protein [Gammaproteobacteria bacterium]